jgi:hypothetical protein
MAFGALLPTGGMTQNDIFVFEMNIARYRAMLQFDMDAEKRSLVERLLAKAEAGLTALTLDASRDRRT